MQDPSQLRKLANRCFHFARRCRNSTIADRLEAVGHDLMDDASKILAEPSPYGHESRAGNRPAARRVTDENPSMDPCGLKPGDRSVVLFGARCHRPDRARRTGCGAQDQSEGTAIISGGYLNGLAHAIS
jgi:hypothetical protein